MPQDYTYQITAGGRKYRITSPTELTDDQAYEYAAPDIDADLARDAARAEGDAQAAAAQARAADKSQGGVRMLRGAGQALLDMPGNLWSGAKETVNVLDDLVAPGGMERNAERAKAAGRGALTFAGQAVRGELEPEDIGGLVTNLVTTRLVPPVVRSAPLPIAKAMQTVGPRMTGAGNALSKEGALVRSMAGSMVGGAPGAAIAALLPVGLRGAGWRLADLGKRLQQRLSPPQAPAVLPSGLRSTTTGNAAMAAPPAPSAPMPSPLVPGGPTSTVTGGLRVPAPPAPPVVPPGLLPTPSGAGGPLVPAGQFPPVPVRPTPPAALQPTPTGAQGAGGLIPPGNFGPIRVVPEPPVPTPAPAALRPTGTGTPAGIVPQGGFSLPVATPKKAAAAAATAKTAKPDVQTKPKAEAKAASSASPELDSPKSAATTDKPGPTGTGKYPAPNKGVYSDRQVNTANGILKRRQMPEIADITKMTAAQKEILDDVVAGRKHAEATFQAGKK